MVFGWSYSQQDRSFLAQRDVDATGAVQTPEIIMLNIFVLALPFIIPLLI
ncbi:DUF3923 family protein [Salicibibacter cibarius]|nr:DUF3923 family protein [Salicibibacter cibarius]